jgi:uncharacterized membrane protein
MRKPLLPLSAVLAGGVLSLAGLAFSFVLTFFAMFYALRVVCWVTKTDAYMFLMWFGIVLVPAIGFIGFALCATCAAAYIDRRRNRQ